MLKVLLRLMAEESFTDITIQQITDHADLSRRTFYRNFSTKEELLGFYFSDLSRQYIDLLKKEKDLSLPSITRVFFQFWSGHMDLLTLLRSQNLMPLVLDQLNHYIFEVYSEIKGEREEYADPDDRRLALAFSVGGFWNLLSTWLKTDMQKGPEDLEKIIKRALGIL